MATKYIDRIVANTGNVVGNLGVDGTLYTSNVNGSSNFGIQMNVANYNGDITDAGNITVENVYGNIEISTYSGNLDEFSGNIGTIQNVGSINGDIIGNVVGDIDVMGNINGDILGNLNGDYSVYGNVGNISNITAGRDVRVQGGVENYYVSGNVETMDIVGNVLGGISAGNIIDYRITGNVGNIINPVVGQVLSIQGNTGTLDIDSNTVGNINVNGNVETLNISDLTEAYIQGNVEGNINAENYTITNFSGNLDVSNIGGNVVVAGNVGNIVGGTTNVNIDSNVVDLGAVVRLNTLEDPITGSGIAVANIDGVHASLGIDSDGQWVFSSSSDAVVLTPHVTASNSLIVGNDDVIDINGGSVQNASTYIYTSHSTTGTILEASITDFIADIRTVVETDSGTEFMSGVIAGNGTLISSDSTSTDLSYGYLPGLPNTIFIDPSTAVITRQTSTITLTLL